MYPPTFSNDAFDELAAWLIRRRTGITDVVELGVLDRPRHWPEHREPDALASQGLGRAHPQIQGHRGDETIRRVGDGPL